MLPDLPDGDLRSAISALAESVRDGKNVVVAPDAERVTPATAARILGVSRTHLYKILDAGDLAFVPVGRDRRISLEDLREYAASQSDVRKATAERLAHPERTRAAALEAYKAKVAASAH